jgi:hypothetical protein
MTVHNLLSTVDRLGRRSRLFSALVDAVADRVLPSSTAYAGGCGENWGPWTGCRYDPSGRCASRASNVHTCKVANNPPTCTFDHWVDCSVYVCC